MVTFDMVTEVRHEAARLLTRDGWIQHEAVEWGEGRLHGRCASQALWEAALHVSARVAAASPDRDRLTLRGELYRLAAKQVLTDANRDRSVEESWYHEVETWNDSMWRSSDQIVKHVHGQH
jgi:hypothetical protein